MNARDTVLTCYEKIAAHNENINAVKEINADALFEAEALDKKPKSLRGALYGEAILLKDNVSTRDSTHTSAGSLALKNHYAAEDAHIVTRLKNADAVILGKANMTEFANFMTRNMPSGYSSMGGQVKNPHNENESPSGSSSGSAAAVAMGFCTSAIGTETSGSILSPAQCLGICGIKPTVGLVSRAGIIPISSTMDTAGPMAQTVRGAARLLSAIAGYDPNDAATKRIQHAPPIDYEKSLHKNGLSCARIGVNRGLSPSESYKPHSERLLAMLKDAGATLVEMPPIPNTPAGMRIMMGEFRGAMDTYLATAGRNAEVRTLAQIESYNNEHADTCLKYGQSLITDALRPQGDARRDAEYLLALAERARLTDQLLSLYSELQLDAIVECAGYNNIAPVSGFPAGTVAIGRYKNNVPVGCYFMCEPFREDKLLSILYAVEQKVGFICQDI